LKISIRPSGAALKASSVIDSEEYKSAEADLILRWFKSLLVKIHPGLQLAKYDEHPIAHGTNIYLSNHSSHNPWVLTYLLPKNRDKA
jgi:hypothetical protein